MTTGIEGAVRLDHHHAVHHAVLFGLSRAWPARTLVDGEVLFFQNDVADELIYLDSGALEVYVDGRLVNRLGQGELVGEASAFMPLGARTATLRAQGPVAVRGLTYEAVRALRKNHPEAYDAVLETALASLARRVRATSARLARLAEGIEGRPESGPVQLEAAPQTPTEKRLGHHAARLVLRTLGPLAQVADDHLDALAASMVSHTLAPGDMLCAAGEIGDSMFLVGDGELEVTLNVSKTRSIKAATVGRGSMMGALGLLLGTARSANLVARSSCWVLEIRRDGHAALEGEVGRIWRETLLSSLRDQLISANDGLAQLEARRAERIDRDYDYADTVSSLGNTLSWPIKEPARLAEVRRTATRILEALAPHRRLLPKHPEDPSTCHIEACEQCFALHRPKVERAVAADRPIHLILPAFPAKSPDTQKKVLGLLPDMAEEVALRYLQTVADDIAAVYAPGARITLCSDGRVFADLVLVGDEAISAYGQSIERMIDRLGLDAIDVFNLEDLFQATTFEGMRDHLVEHYADTLESVKLRSKTGPDRYMYNGIHRFLFEDAAAIQTDKSRTRIRKEAGQRAYGVIQRSNAFSRLIAECFPHSIRLSIHPQVPHGPKMGILLGRADGCWITPWHGVVVLDDEGYQLVKRSQAEEMGAQLVMRNGVPSHFTLRQADIEGDAQPQLDWRELYDYWFSQVEDAQEWVDGRLPIWFFADAVQDTYIRERFVPWLSQMDKATMAEWKSTARGWLSLILLFDQVPRNAFRDTVEMFAHDWTVRAMADEFRQSPLFDELSAIEAFWVFLPYQHQENPADQVISVEGVRAQSERCLDGHRRFFGIANDMAERHLVAIERFGRFPHRNSILGRSSTADERAFLTDPRNNF